MHLVLVGSKASGKSTIGQMVADSLDLPFEDADAVLETVHAERTGEQKTFREIFRERGETYFRELEEEALRRCLEKSDRVVALGGGTPVRLKSDGVFQPHFIVYLEASPDVLWGRVEGKELPAYLDLKNPRADFERILAERTPIYEEIADLRVNAGRRPEEVAAEVAAGFQACRERKQNEPPD